MEHREWDLERRVITTLEQHGLWLEVAREVYQMGEALRTRTLADGQEYAAMLAADSGAQLGTILAGESHAVDLAPHIETMRSDRSYIQMHTHPGSTTFSPTDGEILVVHAAIRIILAVGADGTWYVLSKNSGFVGLQEGQAQRIFSIEFDQIKPELLRRAVRGDLTITEFQPELRHQVWSNIAPLMGLRYDRIRP